ncbi:MAG: aminotransferase class I/II-fold pyridoxal phosphate-dependent enzyme [Anaerolineales bacterium]|nr:aminotransferase class I/II-fold pyridoxal phosphate-dependent enzyme [Anaerolineales bacterium]
MTNHAPSTNEQKDTGPGTRSVHAGEQRPYPHHALSPPIAQTATYTFEDSKDLTDFMDRRMWGMAEGRVEYGRYGNPTVTAAENKLAALDRGEEAILFSSGMNAITTTLLSLLKSGDHIVITDDAYRRTRQFCQDTLSRFGIECTPVPAGDLGALEAALQPQTRLIMSESPTNPYLRVMDLESLSEIAADHGAKTLIDATFATPINQRPLEHGIDLVLHSATKYIGGHNDVLAGSVTGAGPLIAMIRQTLWVMGGVIDPHAAFLVHRGLKSLALRVRQQNRTAQAIAESLQAEPEVERVWYPGLASHPDHSIATAQMEGFGGVVSFELNTDLRGTSQFIDAVNIPVIASSLGGLETLIEQPALMSYYELSSEERADLGIKENLVRLAVGIEDPEDLITDLRSALRVISPQPAPAESH